MSGIETKPTTEPELKDFLHAHKVDTSQWGTGAAKSVNHLSDEIKSGESVLHVDDEGRVGRRVEVAEIDVLHERISGGADYLREEKQVFVDGRERVRTLATSVGEKLSVNEHPDDAAFRGIVEELRISKSGLLGLYRTPAVRESTPSPSYPGITTTYVHHRYVALLDDTVYNPDGYVEQQADKNTYFVWTDLSVYSHEENS